MIALSSTLKIHNSYHRRTHAEIIRDNSLPRSQVLRVQVKKFALPSADTHYACFTQDNARCSPLPAPKTPYAIYFSWSHKMHKNSCNYPFLRIFLLIRVWANALGQLFLLIRPKAARRVSQCFCDRERPRSPAPFCKYPHD